MSENMRLTQDLGFVRVGMAVPKLRVADVDFNVEAMGELIVQAHALHVQLLAFPEMSITSYTLGDLVHHKVLLSKAVEGLK